MKRISDCGNLTTPWHNRSKPRGPRQPQFRATLPGGDAFCVFPSLSVTFVGHGFVQSTSRIPTTKVTKYTKEAGRREGECLRDRSVVSSR